MMQAEKRMAKEGGLEERGLGQAGMVRGQQKTVWMVRAWKRTVRGRRAGMGKRAGMAARGWKRVIDF